MDILEAAVFDGVHEEGVFFGSAAVDILEAEVFDGVHEEGGVFFGSASVDSMAKVHYVVTPTTVAEDLLSALLLFQAFTRHRQRQHSETDRVGDTGSPVASVSLSLGTTHVRTIVVTKKRNFVSYTE